MFELKHQGAAFLFCAGERRLRISFWSDSIVRVSYTEGREFLDRDNNIVCAAPEEVQVTAQNCGDSFQLRSSALCIQICKRSGALAYYDKSGRLLMREPERGGKWLTLKDIHRNIFDRETQGAFSQNVDGARASAAPDRVVYDRSAFEARLEFQFSPDEALFGLGSHEEGFGNLRGKSRDLYQQNMKAVVPFLVSTRGYGVLLNCGSAMTFHDDENGSWWWADCVDALDFYFIHGSSYDEVHQGYQWLTGRTPMLPSWALGYVQSKERYVHAEEILEIVREYRRRKIPLDGIVLDWKSWPDGGGWGQKEFDPVRFPDPEKWIAELHSLHVHLMVSIWPIMTGGCSNQREMLDHDWMLGNQSTYDAFLPDARSCYWAQADHGLFSKGVDAWWCDCTEPFESDWSGAVKPEPRARFALNTAAAKAYMDAAEINLYSLAHSQGIYEGQRSGSTGKRVVNLTRSSYAGQHRYGTITWNGDVSATWETLRRCIPEGVNFCASGEPFWTVDIGGFFVDHWPDLWFWRGDYSDGCRGLTSMDAREPDPDDTGCRDLGYWELYTRWLQYAAFLPMFRSHGTDASREIWRFGEAGTPFYDAIARFIRLRYEMQPYLYALAARVTHSGLPMICAVALRYPEDSVTHPLDDQFFLGPSLMVCPVTRPMYYAADSKTLSDQPFSRDVYLPAGAVWFDYWTEQVFEGGQKVMADAPLEKIPLFVPGGSILCMTQVMQYVSECPDAPYEIRIYTGADAEFVLYEDSGDGYGYEQGSFAEIKLTWKEQSGSLIIAERKGAFPELVQEREYRIVFVSKQGREEHRMRYRGEQILVRPQHIGERD